MEASFLSTLRDENKQLYGTAVSEYAPDLLSEIYKDRTHFLFELIQNAEDACARMSKKGVKKKFFMNFSLFEDRLEVRHNGDPFDDDDIKSICRIARSKKRMDVEQIGKFGVGFKSVYAYTNKPEIHSGNRSFYIKNYVQPFEVAHCKDANKDETLIVIPFNSERTPRETSFKEIKARLSKLGMRTLLFINNIEEIHWNADGRSGKYKRTVINSRESVKCLGLSREENGSEVENEDWLLFEKKLSKGLQKIGVAFLFENRKKIVQAKNTRLFAYFQTGKETSLKFNIHGPYQTTLSRDDIKDNDWNANLIDQTAELVADVIPILKKMRLLDVGCLGALPTQYNYFSTQDSIFKPIYDAVVKKLSGGEDLLPTYKNEYTSASKALISRGIALRELLTPAQLKFLLDHECKWLHEDITKDKTPELLDYLQKELKVSVFTPEEFGFKISTEFLSKQTPEWITSFYVYLLGQEALWRDKNSGFPEGVLRSKAIIRLSNGQYVAPYDRAGKPLAYLPSKTNKMFQNVVDEAIVKNDKAKEFLKRLGLREPDNIAGLIELIFPKYKLDSTVEENENVQDVTSILSTLSAIFHNTSSRKNNYEISIDPRKQKLLTEVQNTRFLFAKNIANNKGEYLPPKKVYVGKDYTGNKDIEAYFEGNDSAYLLDNRYKNLKIDLQLLEFIGCRTGIAVHHSKTSYGGYVILADEYGHHKRGVDGFDPDCTIDGLEYALKHINKERFSIIWSLLQEHYRSISGVVETDTKKDFTSKKPQFRFSKMGMLLVNNAWILDASGHYHKPSELFYASLPPEIQNMTESKFITKQLQFKVDMDEKLLSNFKGDIKELIKKIYEYQDVLTGNKSSKLIDMIRTLSTTPDGGAFTRAGQAGDRKEPAPGGGWSRNPVEARKLFDDSLSITKDHISDLPQSKKWTVISPEDEEDMRKRYRGELPEIVDRLHRVCIASSHKIIDIKGCADPKVFLNTEYDGHCQVCNARLDVGASQPLYHMMRLVDINKYIWSNMEFNVICLCPNHYALLKYGKRDLRGIVEIAKKVIDGDAAPEAVEERHGDYYIIKVKIAGKEEEIHYSQNHMSKFSAFIELTDKELQR